MSAPDLSACAELVRRGDPDRFLSAMTAPPALRERLFALYAFNLEVARIASVVSEPMLGLIRLQWWRETIDGVYAGDVRAHEVAQPLAETIAAADLPKAPFDRLLDARGWDIEPEPFADMPALHAHLEATGGGLLALSAQAMTGAPTDVADAGFAFAAAAWLRAAPALSAQGLPPWPPGSRKDHAQGLARDGLAALARARRQGAPRAAAPALRAGWRSRAALRGALAADFDPMLGPVEESPFRRQAGLLWRAATGGW